MIVKLEDNDCYNVWHMYCGIKDELVRNDLQDEFTFGNEYMKNEGGQYFYRFEKTVTPNIGK